MAIESESEDIITSLAAKVEADMQAEPIASKDFAEGRAELKARFGDRLGECLFLILVNALGDEPEHEKLANSLADVLSHEIAILLEGSYEDKALAVRALLELHNKTLSVLLHPK